MHRPKILFLCTGNSCRSQMAEGWCRHYWGDQFEIFSAGTHKHGMNPRAVKVMEEAGVDLSLHYSKTLDDLAEGVRSSLDYVFTVCGHAHETCPWFSGNAKVQFVGFEDPPKLSQGMENEEEILNEYRKVRDEIEIFVKGIKRYL